VLAVETDAHVGLQAGEAARPEEDESSIFTHINMSVISYRWDSSIMNGLSRRMHQR
jgi:hypothetical protein